MLGTVTVLVALLAETDGRQAGALIGFFIAVILAGMTARNGRWGLFVLGFLCGLAWLVGALMGKKSRY